MPCILIAECVQSNRYSVREQALGEASDNPFRLQTQAPYWRGPAFPTVRGAFAQMSGEATNSIIVAGYRARTRGSAALAEAAKRLLPSGMAHDARQIEPYGIYVERAAGPRKWDVDGNEYVDYFGGHGALLLGHNHPAVTAAVEAALAAAPISAPTIRARSLGRGDPPAGAVGGAHPVHLIGHRGHADGGAAGARIHRPRHADPFQGTFPRLARPHDVGLHATISTARRRRAWCRAWRTRWGWWSRRPAAVEAALAAGDVAAVIVEPTGSSFGQVPLRPEFLHALRRLTERAGALLILDEVVTGFRVSPGGAQVAFGVRPDLSSFAKIVAGGLPGAAVAGRAEIMELLDFAASGAAGREKIHHPGTFNANPVSAAAGTAALEVIAETDANARADATAAALRSALNEVLAEAHVPWAVYGTSSGFHLFMNPRGRPVTPGVFDPLAVPAKS